MRTQVVRIDTDSVLSRVPTRSRRPADDEQSDATMGISTPVLRAAIRSVLARWRAETGDASELGEVGRELVLLAAAIEAAWRAPESEVGIDTSSVLRRRLLELLRAQAIEYWTVTEPDAADMLEILAAFERVQTALDPEWPRYFAARLTIPEGLEVLAEIAHDLRSPLTSILTLAEALQRGQSGEVNDVQHRQLGLVYSAALGLSTVASDLIELAHGCDRLAEKEPVPFWVSEVLESVRDIVQPMADEKGLTVRILPPEVDHRTGHPLALSRVLLNLTTNALKFTEEGFVEVVAESKHNAARVRFSVRDTGKGINPRALKDLYQPFRRRDGRKAYCFSGTGLGLAISRKLVEAMGGGLEFESRAGWGTRFFFDLEMPPADAR